MDLRALFRGMGVDVPGDDVADITAESRTAQPGGLFLACAGTRRHGLDFLGEAIAAGVRAVAWEPGPGIDPPRLPPGVAGIPVPGLSRRQGELADRFFAAPSAEVPVAGITGTNGKTTTAWLVVQALGRLRGPAGYMGTLGHGIGTDLAPGPLTTPGCVTVHRQMRALIGAGARYIVAEVSSHALDQGRVDGVRFHTAAFTNLTRDHLDYHGDLDRYGAAKARLFAPGPAAPRVAVINVGDAFGRVLAGGLGPQTRLLSVALAADDGATPRADFVGRLRSLGTDGLTLDIAVPGGEVRITSRLWGRFNAENLLVALGILVAQGFGPAEAAEALSGSPAPPGRMEAVAAPDPARPRVLVDFAHTPDALEKAIGAVREHCTGRVTCVFGCGGERDRGKRAPMGGAAARLADLVVVTSDNPRGEDPGAIIADILAGIPDRSRVSVEPDRAAAIALAIRAASPGDVVLIAGKGHEQLQVAGGVARPFSDAAVARAVLGGTP